MKTFEQFKKYIAEDGDGGGTVGVTVNPAPGGSTENTNSVINPNNQGLGKKKKIVKRPVPNVM
jgi:hypothetical protein